MQKTDTDLRPNVDQDVQDIDEAERDDVEDIGANIRSSRGVYIYIYI